MMKPLYYLLPILAISAFLYLQSDIVFGADSGFRDPTAAANDDTVGTGAWVNEGNVFASDDSKATRGGFAGSYISNYLKATAFGFAIPGGATIDGIEVQIEKLGGTVTDEYVQIVKADATIGTTNKADTTTSWPDADAYVTYGGAADLWDETWTSTDINDADFGVVIAADVVHPASIAVDHIQVKVYYTEASDPDVPGSAAINTGSVQIRTGSVQFR